MKQNLDQNYANKSIKVGVICNLLLSISKIIIGSLFGAIAIIADGYNNLSDLGGNIIMIISSRISSKPADKKHPYGHHRVEYIATLVIVFFIFILSYGLIKSAIEKIINPRVNEYSPILVIVLVISIIIKTFMYFYNTKLAKISNSSMLRATALDSLTDSISTLVILIGVFCSKFFNINLDAPLAIIVAIIVIIAGVGILKDTFDQLLGEGISEKKANEIHDRIMKYKGVYGTHDLMGHYYGQNQLYASVHVEVDASVPIMESHDMIDVIEKDFSKDMNLVIHMDPIVLKDPYVNQTREKFKDLVSKIYDKLSIHDFRMVVGTTHTNVIFDLVIPFNVKNISEITNKIKEEAKKIDDKFILVISIDRAG